MVDGGLEDMPLSSTNSSSSVATSNVKLTLNYSYKL